MRERIKPSIISMAILAKQKNRILKHENITDGEKKRVYRELDKLKERLQNHVTKYFESRLPLIVNNINSQLLSIDEKSPTLEVKKSAVSLGLDSWNMYDFSIVMKTNIANDANILKIMAVRINAFEKDGVEITTETKGRSYFVSFTKIEKLEAAVKKALDAALSKNNLIEAANNSLVILASRLKPLVLGGKTSEVIRTADGKVVPRIEDLDKKQLGPVQRINAVIEKISYALSSLM